MNKRILLMILIISTLVSGCQLANPEASGERQSDCLVGAYITSDYIETEQEKIYATVENDAITFANIDGMLMVSYWKQLGADGYWTSECSEGILDLHNEYITTDEGQERRQCGYIYVPCNTGEVLFYMNPVYQTPDQQIYLIPGTGISMSTGLAGEMRQALTEEVTHKTDGVESRNAVEVEIVVDCVDIPNKVVLSQMDKNNLVLWQMEYFPDTMPEIIEPEKDAAYILIESHYNDGITRSVQQPGDDDIAVFILGENNICNRNYTQVHWTEQS